MSDLLRLTARLRAASDETLLALVQERQLNTASLRDLFDLGEALLSNRNLQATIASLPATKLSALDLILSDAEAPQINPRDARALEELQLVYRDGDQWHSYAAVAETLATLRSAKANPKQKPTLVVMREQRDADSFSLTFESTRAALGQEEIDRDCGIAMFETIQAITELLFMIDQHFVREVARGNVGLPDLKRLGARLNKTTEYARLVFDVAAMAQVIVLRDSRWQRGSQANNWIDANQFERWAMLADAWLAALGKASRSELTAVLPTGSPAVALGETLGNLYPLADASTSAHIARIVDRGNLIGLTDNGLVASWTNSLLASGSDACKASIEQRLPAAIDRLIVQADLSLVAPGPLTTATEIRIRQFAECEQIGFASTYRISALSITLGMEHGLTAQLIRELLTELSGKALPQPVEYLIRESEERFGRLVVHESSYGDHSVATSSDPILLKSILGDPAMKPFGLVLTSEGQLACKFDAAVLYYGLREAGYAAIRASHTAETSLLLADASAIAGFGHGETPVEGGPAFDLKRMREQDSKPGLNPDSDDVTRQIQLAIKNRVRLSITVTTSGGDSQEFLLEPTGIANGRLRAKDRKADIERTLPLTSITAVSLA